MLRTNKWYILFILTLVYVFNFIDRQIISILAEAIKKDLGFSDTQIGIMTGTAFAVFYSTMSIPISRVADKGNRKSILAFCLAIWSAMTALSGMANSFWQMALARMGVGIGEAGGVPTSYAIISDTFPPNQRGRALSIFSMGISIGIFLAFAIAGVVLVNYGWRFCLYLVGLPGILLAILVHFSIQEPQKGFSDNVKATRETPSLLQVIKTLRSKKTFIYITLAKSFLVFTSYSINAFLPILFIRVHQVEIKTLSIILGLSIAVGGVTGSLLGGFLSDKLGKKNVSWYAWVGVLGGILSLAPYYYIFMTNNAFGGLYMVSFTSFTASLTVGPAIAVMQSLVNAKMRASTAALYLLISNLVGLGLGPLIIGIISDYLAPTYGVESIRYALMFTFVSSILAIIFFWIAGNTYKKDICVTM